MQRVILTAIILIIPSIVFAESESKRAVTVGVLTDLSGFGAYYGQQTKAGALLAQQEIKNAGGEVRLVFEDSQLNTQRAVTSAHNLIFREKVDAVYVDFGVIAMAVSSILENAKLPFIYVTGAPSIAKKSNYARKSYLDFMQGCEAVAREFAKRGVKKLGFLHSLAEFGELCRVGLVNVFPEVVVQEYTAKESVATQMLKLKNSGVEAIVNVGFEGDIINMLQEKEKLKFAVPIGTAADCLPTSVRERHAETIDGSLTFGFKLLSGEVIANAQKLLNNQSLSGAERVGIARLHTWQIFNAAQNCATADPVCLLRNLDKSPAQPEVGFLSWKDRIAKFETVVEEIVDGKSRFVGSYVGKE